MKINVCTAVNAKYVKYLNVMLVSLFENHGNDRVCVYILHNDLEDTDIGLLETVSANYDQELKFLYIDSERFGQLPLSERITIESYFRLMITEMILTEDRILYLDVDLIVNGSLNELYEIAFEDNYAVACQDMLHPVWSLDYKRIFNIEEERDYFNAGVMLWNLGRIRQDFTFDKFISVAEKVDYELPHHDQTILNFCFYGKIKLVEPRKWNYLPASDFRDGKTDWSDIDARIIHYATKHPWDTVIKPNIINKWWFYAKNTPQYVQLLEEQVERLEKSNGDDIYKEVQRVEIEAVLENMVYEAEKCELKKLTVDKQFVFYGAGHMAELLINLLEYEGAISCVKAIIDKKREGMMKDIPIQSNYLTLQDGMDYILVVTPSYKKKELMRELSEDLPSNIKMITSLQFLRKEWN